MSKTPTNAGFSLIEIMVVMSLTALIMVGGFEYVKVLTQKQDLNSAMEEIVIMLKQARNLAVTRQRTTGQTTNPPYVSVSISSGGNINIFSGTDPVYSFVNKPLTAKTVRVTKSNGNDTIRFLPFEGSLVGTTGTPLGIGPSIVITIGSTDPGVGETRTVVVKTSGVVDVRR